MSSRLKVAVRLQPGADGTAAETREQARHAERLGLDGIFIGDHLRPAGPYPDSIVVLAAAAGVTERIQLGAGVLVLALRDPAWAAKQIASLQHVSGGRVVLGIGVGGAIHGTEAWEAVGVPYAERGRRTDEALELLPALIRGETVELPSGASITLSPGADVPPILIGGNSPVALRRAVRHGAGWFPGMATPRQVADGAGRLHHGAEIAAGGVALLGAEADPRIDRFVASLADGLGIPPADAAELPITGTPPQAAERFAAYADAGATWLVLGTIGDDWHAQWELVAEAAALLDGD
jgi:alkanesulfonate monooxygenase SsuD/methylene tetrahydromethanopterin reductase-like flavin-dependent oxidoreductase (luciferase family)